MRRALLVLSTLSAPVLAHPGHGATPAHVHVAHGVPVDVGALVFVAALAVALGVAFVRNRARD